MLKLGFEFVTVQFVSFNSICSCWKTGSLLRGGNGGESFVHHSTIVKWWWWWKMQRLSPSSACGNDWSYKNAQLRFSTNEKKLCYPAAAKCPSFFSIITEEAVLHKLCAWCCHTQKNEKINDNFALHKGQRCLPTRRVAQGAGFVPILFSDSFSSVSFTRINEP